MPARPLRLHPDLGYPTALLAFGALTLRPLLRGESLLGGDLVVYNLPMFERLGEIWTQAAVPGWEPRLGLGRPLSADLSHGVHYPGYAITGLLPALTALNVFLAMHMALWLLGVYALARQLRLSPSGAFVAAAVHVLGGLGMSCAGSVGLLVGPSWMPWCALGVVRAARSGATGGVFWAACPFALLCLSASPIEYLLGAGCVAIGSALASGAPLRRVVAILIPTALLAIGLAAIGLFPLVAILDDLSRGTGLSQADSAQWSLHPLELLGGLVPQLFWPDGGGLPAATIGLRDGSRPWFCSLYVGLLPPALAALALRAPRVRREWALLALAASITLYAFGHHTPLHGWVWKAIPPLRSLRYPAKYFVPASLALALLAGIGWGRAASRPRRLVPGLLLGAGAVLALTVAGRGGGLLERAALPLVAATLVALLAVRGLPQKWVPCVLGVELVLAAPYAQWTAPNQLLTEPATMVAPVLEAQAREGGPLRVAVAPGSDRLRVELPHVRLGPAAAQAFTTHELLTPNSASYRGVATVWAFSGVHPARRMRYDQVRPNSGLDVLEQYRRLGAGLLIHTSDQAHEDALEPLARAGPWTLSRLRGALPWASVQHEVTLADDLDAALVRTLSPAHDPARGVVLEADAVELEGGAPEPGGVQLLTRAGDVLRLEVTAARAGVLVVREAWARGWSATLDGAPVPVWPADVLFRGLPVPAGRHTVEMRYTAPGQAWGAAVSLVSLVAVLLGGLWWLRNGARPSGSTARDRSEELTSRTACGADPAGRAR